MASTTDERPGSGDDDGTSVRTGSAAGEGRHRRFRLRDLYIERRDGPVTMAERRRAALTALIGLPLFVGLVVTIQAGVRDREVPAPWLISAAVMTVVMTVLGFAFPRFSPSGWAHLHSTDWSRESPASKVVAVVALLLLVAVVVARTIWRMER